MTTKNNMSPKDILAAATLELKRAKGALKTQDLSGRCTDKQAERVAAAILKIEEIKKSEEYCRAIAMHAEIRKEEKRQMKIARDKRRRDQRTEEEKEKEKAYARERMRINRLNGNTAAYRSKPETKNNIKKLKEKYRRQAGSIPREEVAARAIERKQRIARLKEERTIYFVGPPIPSKAMSDAELYRWKTRTDADFYCAELDRAQAHKAKKRPGYRDSIVKWADMPAAMKQAKHALYLVAREIEANHEKH